MTRKTTKRVARRALPMRGLAVAGAAATLIYFATRAEAAPPPPPPPPPGLANLYGAVTNEVGNPLKDVLISLDGYQVLTDTSGNYQLINLPIGTYSGSASKSGYVTKYF